MSEPRSHHFVPRVHIRKFKTEHGYYVLSRGSVRTISSSRNIFCINDLNTTIDETGGKDRKTLETELDRQWDSKFNFHLAEIRKALDKRTEIDPSTLVYFWSYTILGVKRRLKATKDYNLKFMKGGEAMLQVGKELANQGFFKNDPKDELSLGEMMEELEKFLLRQSKAKYPGMISGNVEDYVPKELVGIILKAENCSFLLPDCTGIIYPHEETHIVKGSKINKFSSIGLPLTPDLYLLIQNKELNPHSIASVAILNKEEVQELNEFLFLGSFDQVLCDEKEELERFRNAQDS